MVPNRAAQRITFFSVNGYLKYENRNLSKEVKKHWQKISQTSLTFNGFCLFVALSSIPRRFKFITKITVRRTSSRNSLFVKLSRTSPGLHQLIVQKVKFFFLRISLVNVNKFAENYGFVHIYWRNPQQEILPNFLYSDYVVNCTLKTFIKTDA